MSSENEPGSGKWKRLTREVVESKIRETGGPLRLSVPPILHVDLNFGTTSAISADIDPDDEHACLQAWIEAQSGFVPLPAIGGDETDGFTMTGRVLGSYGGEDDQYATPGAALLIIESPNGAWVMTVGFARREEETEQLWRMLIKLANGTAKVPSRPSLPWVVRHVAANNKVSSIPTVLGEIARVESAMVASLARYYTVIDYINS